MRAFHQGHAGAAGRAAGGSSARPQASPLSAAWIRHVQRVAAAGHDTHEVAPEAEHAQVQRAALDRALGSPARPMEPGLRSEMEQRFGGTDFGGVLVHDGPAARESAAVLEAKAFTSGRHVVDGGGMTKKDWAHELAHFEDQQAGPVPGTNNGAGVSMSAPGDPGERHAETKADRVMSGPVPVQRTAAGTRKAAAAGCAGGDGCGGDGTAVQRLHVIKAGSTGYPKKEPDSDDFFVGQDTNDQGSWFDERSPYAPPKPHLVYAGEVDLAVSDGFDLAVEHAGDGKEPKNFFATDKQLSASIKNLPGAGQKRGLSLSKTGRTLTIEGSGRKVVLHEVEPKYRKEKGGEKTKGLDVLTPQRCNSMLGFVTGKSAMYLEADKRYWDTIEKFLVRMEPEGGWKGKFQEAIDGGDTAGYDRIAFGMSGRFQELVRQSPQNAERVLRDLEANQHAAIPRVGDGMVTMARPDAEQHETRLQARREGADNHMDYHYGGVVAVSGSDYITMENYAREQHNDSLNTLDRNDPLWYFRMYGKEAGRTWHEGWTSAAGNGFLGATLTLTLRH
ncbi:eCIS core domain-containing protein [Streptomyces sp. CA-179760]|uniref:eCIS core domain-containing protein n=1 Tax=Streptomyces sp. CA-179760 TaxID=3240054 RepID=UPI003D8C0831